MKRFIKVLIAIGYILALTTGVLLLFLSLYLLVRGCVCIDIFHLQCDQCSTCNKTPVSTYIGVVATSTVGSVAAIFQIVTLVKGLCSSYRRTKQNTISAFSDFKKQIEKNFILLDDLKSFNKNEKLKFIYDKKKDSFILGMEYIEYQSYIIDKFLDSDNLHVLVGDKLYFIMLENKGEIAETDEFAKVLLSTLTKNIRDILDETCRLLDDLLCTYYSGYFNIQVFKKFKSSYLIETISKIKYYAAMTYERDKKNNIFIYNYKYLIKFIKDIVVKEKCFNW